MAKAILNKFIERFISKKLLCLFIGIGMELYGVAISDNLLLLMVSYIGGQAVVDAVSKVKAA